jgi:hypothetical protein
LYPGIVQHPDYPSLLAKFEAWREQQAGLYRSLKAAE